MRWEERGRKGVRRWRERRGEEEEEQEYSSRTEGASGSGFCGRTVHDQLFDIITFRTTVMPISILVDKCY